MKEIKVVHLDTYSIIALYSPKFDRVEISEHLKEFPQLYAFVLSHELEHAYIQKERGYSLKHILIDYRDRFKLFRSSVLSDQLALFMKKTSPKGLREHLFLFLYNFIGSFAMFFALLKIPRMIKKFIKRLIE